MSLQYLSDGLGQIVAVQVPIKEWESLKLKYPDTDASAFELPEWQKELIDVRLREIDEHPGRILPIDGLFAELDHN